MGASVHPYLSVVIPALNEERRLPSTLQRLRTYLSSCPYTFEIVVVSNGSTDQTDQAVQRVAAETSTVRLISIGPRGKGIATRTGVLATSGEIVFLCDADLSMPAEQIEAFLDGLERVDIVSGSREAPGARRFNEPSHRHLMGRVFNRVVQLIAVPGINDTQCGFKAFRREAATTLFSRQTTRGWGFDVEVLYLARKFGFRIEEMPIDWYFDTDTRVRPGVDSLAMLWEVVMIRLRDALGRYGAGAGRRASETDVA